MIRHAENRTAFSHLRRGPSGQIADGSGVIEVHRRRLDRAFQHIVGIEMQQEDDAQRFNLLYVF